MRSKFFAILFIFFIDKFSLKDFTIISGFIFLIFFAAAEDLFLLISLVSKIICRLRLDISTLSLSTIPI